MGAPADGKRDITTRWTDDDIECMDIFAEAMIEEDSEDWSRNKAIRTLLRIGYKAWAGPV